MHKHRPEDKETTCHLVDHSETQKRKIFNSPFFKYSFPPIHQYSTHSKFEKESIIEEMYRISNFLIQN